LEQGSDRVLRRFDEQVQAVRIGTVTAYDAKAARRWEQQIRSHGRPKKPGLSGAALHRTIMRLARARPDIVAIRGKAA
jgi:hypothetical protein